MLTNKEIDPIVRQVTEGTVTDPEVGPLDGTIQDAAYQISRGIRLMALLGHVPPNPTTMSRAYYRLVYLGGSQGAGALLPIPFVIEREDKTCADAGFAARQWVVETFVWIKKNAPPPHLNRLLGLLLGYSPDAIAVHDEAQMGIELIKLDEQAPT